MKFIDFNLTITRFGEDLVVSFVGPGGSVIHEKTLLAPPTHDEIEILRHKVEKDAQATVSQALELEQAFSRGIYTEADSGLKEIGQKLFSWVFCGKVLAAFKQRHLQARGNDQGLRVRVTINPQQHDLGIYPFETMFCPELPVGAHIALFGGLTIVRSFTDLRFDKPPAISPPIRILIVGASPRGYQKLDLKREIKNLTRALKLPGIDVRDLEDCTIERLKQLATTYRPHILHFIGHGDFDKQRGEGRIVFANGMNDPEPLSGDELRLEIAQISSLRLVTLNACLGNASDGTQLFSSVATSIFTLQLPAVVAMQYRITDMAAIEFSKSFYSQLALGRPVDDAMTSARAHVRRRIKGSPEWATPVLYLGTVDGDFLGLRLPVSELLAHAVSQLREGNWDIAKSTAMLALEQHGEADQTQAQEIIAFANQCEQLTETYLRVFKQTARSTDDSSDVFEELFELTRDFNEQKVPQILQADPGKCRDVFQLAAALTAFSREEFDEVAALCQQSSNSLLDFNLIAEYARADAASQKELKRLEDLWSTGDWEMVIEAAEKVSPRNDHRQTTARQKIEGMRHAGSELRRTVDALTHKNLKKAQAIMNRIDSAYAPANFELSKRAIDIGVAASECLDHAAISELRLEFENLVSQVEETSIRNTPGVSQVRNLLKATTSELDYKEGLDLYSAGYFTKSKDVLHRLGDYKDAAEKAARSEKWIEIIKQLQLRQWDEAKRLLGELRSEDKSQRVLNYLRWCNWARLVIPVLETMAASPLVYDPLLPWEGSENPYKLFAHFGVSSTSTTQQCTELGYELRGIEQRLDWDKLRLLNKRLILDFLLYTVKNQEVARSLVERLCRVEEGKEKELRIFTTTDLVSELGEDGGVFLVLRKDYDQAITFFLQQAAANPPEITNLHHLGLAAAGKIHLLEDQGRDDDHFALAWEHLIRGWAVIFASDDFWHNWWFTRQHFYDSPINRQDIDDARLQLQRIWLERIRSATEICPGLDTTFRAELNGALAVHAGNGIPLRNHPGEVALLGLQGAKSLGLLDDLSNWTASFPSEALETESWQRSCCDYFSELAEPLAMLQVGRYEEAVDLLTRPRCEWLRCSDAGCKRTISDDISPKVAAFGCRCFHDANPAFSKLPRGAELLLRRAYELLERAHCKVALAAISTTPADNENALAHWRIAVELARRHHAAEELLTTIRGDIVGRANFLVSSLDPNDERTCLDVLNDVIELIKGSYEEKWDSNENVLKYALIDNLLYRAFFLSSILEDHEAARADAMKAYSMEPEHLRAIHILCKVNWFYAWRLHDRGQKAAAEALVKEFEERLKDGDRLFPEHPDLAINHKDFQELRDYIAKVRDVNLENLIKTAPLSTDLSPETQRLSKLAEASFKEAQDQFAEAIKLYDAILQADPDNEEAKARMAYCYRTWIQHESDSAHGSPATIREITNEATRRFPHSDLFTGAKNSE